jgi:hypothetical protein
MARLNRPFLVEAATAGSTPQSHSIRSHAPPSNPLYANFRCSRQWSDLTLISRTNSSISLCSVGSRSPNTSLTCSSVPISSTTPFSSSIHRLPAMSAWPRFAQDFSNSAPTDVAYALRIATTCLFLHSPTKCQLRDPCPDLSACSPHIVHRTSSL